MSVTSCSASRAVLHVEGSSICMSGSLVSTTPEKNRTTRPVFAMICQFHRDPGLIGTRLSGYEAMRSEMVDGLTTCTSLWAGFSTTRGDSGLIPKRSVSSMSGLETTHKNFGFGVRGQLVAIVKETGGHPEMDR